MKSQKDFDKKIFWIVSYVVPVLGIILAIFLVKYYPPTTSIPIQIPVESLEHDENSKYLYDLSMDFYLRNIKYSATGRINGQTFKVENGGIGCGVYSCIMLYKIIYGNNWPTVFRRDWAVFGIHHHIYSSGTIAQMFSLPKMVVTTSDTIKENRLIKLMLETGHIYPGNYMFAVDKGMSGHSGLVTLTADGRLIANQFSMQNPVNGPWVGDFLKWLKWSKYSKGSTVTLWDASNPISPTRTPESVWEY